MKKLIKQFKSLDKKDRIIFFLFCTAISNLFIAIIKSILAGILPSLWFTINAIFSFVIGFTRILAIKHYRKIKLKGIDKIEIGYKNYLRNGIMLIILGISYFSISSYMYFKGTNTTMHEYITYLVALIAFTSIGTAIYGIVKYKKIHDPIIKAVKLTNFANALTSIVLTQVVLLDTFLGGYDSSINGYTGIGVSLIIIGLGLYMILGIKKYLK